MLKKKIAVTASSLLLSLTLITGCSSTQGGEKVAGTKGKDIITIAWLPNESSESYTETRKEISKIIAKATGKEVKEKTTTDYAITIESLASGKVDLAFLGAEGYVETHKKNNKVMPLLTRSGESGTLKDALYYSFLAVNKGDEDQYKKDGKFSIDNIVGKKMSYVSNSSTSGFKVPTAYIIKHFAKDSKWKDLTQDKILEAGEGHFFKEIMFGQSHQGSGVNLLTGKSEVAAFSNNFSITYADAEKGEGTEVGSVYKIRQGAASPFDKLAGKEFVVINSVPVLNGPLAVNTETLTGDDMGKIKEALTAEELRDNSKIFYEPGNRKALIEKKGDSKFVEVEDSWYDPIRKLSE